MNKSSAGSQALLLLEVLKLIPAHRWISQIEIKQGLLLRGIDIPTLTLQRILKTLRESEGLDIECDMRSKPFGYRLGTRSAFSRAKLTVEESLLICLIHEHMKLQLPGSLYSALEPLFDSARNVLEDSPNAQGAKEWLDSVAVVPNSVRFLPPPIKPRIFKTVSDALFNREKLRIVYCRPAAEPKEYIVSPLGLVQQAVKLYLVCCFDGYTDIRHLAVHRIQEAELTGTVRYVPEGFRLDKYLDTVEFNYGYGNRGRVELCIETDSPVMVQILQETPFNAAQTINETVPGIWEIKAEVNDSVLLDGWLTTWKDVGRFRRVTKKTLDGQQVSNIQPLPPE